MSHSLALLGGFECRSADGTVCAIPNLKARALLAHLAMAPDRWLARESLATLFWEDSSTAQARTNLRKTLSRLRQTLPETLRPGLRADVQGIMLAPGVLATDVERFEQCALAHTPETLEEAVALYRGDFLQGMADCGPLFEDWVRGQRQRLEEQLLQVLQRLLDHYMVTGAIDRAVQTALRLLARDPLQEDIHRQLIRLYLYQERLGAALAQYQRCRDVLAAELGAQPAPETEQLRAQLSGLLPGAAPVPESDDVPERREVIQAAAGERRRRRGELGGQPSLAVLCFAGDDERTGAFPLGESLAEDLTTALGRFRELQVMAPSTVFAYRDSVATPQQIGAELGVAYVCEGRVRQPGEQTVVTARLVEVASGRQLWAERYQGDPAGLLALQEDLVQRIASTLIGRIEHAWLDAARRRPPRDWQAYEFWLRGRGLLRRADLQALGEARQCFEAALARDPGFARAYVGLALAKLSEWTCFSWNHWVFLQADALALASKAVELDEHDHQAHCILAMTQLYRRDYRGGEQRLRHALALNPNDADVLAHAAAGLALVGEHDTAVEAGRQALRLAPYHPEWYAAFAGIALFAARCYEEAIGTMAAAPEALCNTPAFIAASYAHLGREAQGVYYRDTVRRHHQLQLSRGWFPRDTGCIDWLLALDPFQQPGDAEHYAEGLRRAGFG